MVGAVVVLQERDEGVQEVVWTQKNQLLQDVCKKAEKRVKAAAGLQIPVALKENLRVLHIWEFWS